MSPGLGHVQADMPDCNKRDRTTLLTFVELWTYNQTCKTDMIQEGLSTSCNSEGTAMAINIGPQQWLQGWVLKQSTHKCQLQVLKLFGVGGVLLGNVVALGTLRHMMLDKVVQQLVDLLFAVCVR